MAGGGFRATGVMIFLLGGVVVLGWLVQQSATAVHRAGEVKQQAVRNVSRDPMIARVMKSDSMLAAIEPPSRDPLGPPPAIGGGAGSRGARPASGETAQASPVVRALLFDNVRPSVKLAVGEELSGWLHEGESFQGWRIAAIEQSGVRVAGAGRALTLPAP